MASKSKLDPFESFVEAALERRSPLRALENSVGKMLRTAASNAGESGPNPNVHNIARTLGVKEVRIVPLPIDGRIVRDGDEIVVEIANNLTQFQRKFTIAHELAHIVLGLSTTRTGRASPKTSVGWASYAELEAFCDFAAEELLAPRTWLRANVNPIKPSLADLRKLSGQSGCPVDFLGVRLIRLRYWDAEIRWCKQVDERIQVTEVFPREKGAYSESIYISKQRTKNVLRALEKKSDAHIETVFSVNGTAEPMLTQWQSIDSGNFIVLCQRHTSSHADRPPAARSKQMLRKTTRRSENQLEISFRDLGQT